MKYKVMIVEDQTMPRELFELRIQSSEHFETVLSIDGIKGNVDACAFQDGHIDYDEENNGYACSGRES